MPGFVVPLAKLIMSSFFFSEWRFWPLNNPYSGGYRNPPTNFFMHPSISPIGTKSELFLNLTFGMFKLNKCDAKQFIFLTAQRNKYQSYFFSFQGPQGPLVLPRLVCPSLHPSDRSCSVIHIVPLTSVTPVTPVTPVTSLTTLTNVAPVTLLHLITSFYTPVTPYHSNVTPL